MLRLILNHDTSWQPCSLFGLLSASIFWLYETDQSTRELLPQDVFTWRYVPGAQPGKIYSYNDFLGGKKSANGRKKSPPLRVIERGLDDAADRILDLLVSSRRPSHVGLPPIL